MWLTGFNGIMQTVLTTGVLGLAAAAVLYALFWLITRKSFAAPFKTHVLRYLFLTYVLCVMLLTLSPGYDTGGSANLTPLSSVLYAVNSGFETARYLIILNILLFLPMVILLPCVFRSVDKLYKAVLISLGATLLIELVQTLLPGRAFDIDDIFMNTLGGAIGYALFTICAWAGKKHIPKTPTKTASFAVLAILPVFIVTVALVNGSREFQYDFNYNPIVPQKFEVTDDRSQPTSAMVYQKETVQPEERLQNLMATFDMNGESADEGSFIVLKQGERSLSVSKETDLWTLVLRTSNDKPPAYTDQELRQQAETFIASYGLWEDFWVFDHAYNVQIDTSGANSWEIKFDPLTGEEIPPDSVVAVGRTLTYRIDEECPHIGSMTVYFDSEGIYELTASLAIYAPYQEAELMSPAEALRALSRSGRCHMDTGGIIEPQKAVIDDIALTYMSGNNFEYNLPAWRLSGTFYETNYEGRKTESQGWLTIAAIRQ